MASSKGFDKEADDDGYEEPRAVRPYAVTGGRTRASGEAIPIEALVKAATTPPGPIEPEKRRIIDLALAEYLSVAEVSAHIHLPVGVVRVLIGDLVEAGLISVHGLMPAPSSSTSSTQYNPATTLSVLESVLNGISAL